MNSLKLLLAFLLGINLASCAFNSEDVESKVAESSSISSASKVALDSDGDMVLDSDELELGRNASVAQIPNLKSRFIQNFEIALKYRKDDVQEVDEKLFVLNTSVYQGNPDFKYRVGKTFARENAFSSAARVGKFSSHSSGEIEEKDLTWIQYPEIDQEFFLRSSLEISRLALNESDITSITAKLENSIKLESAGYFKEIKNLEVSFYYYNYQTDNYELLSTKKIDRHFKAGVNEVFEIELEHLPVNLILDNYLTKGEFIISEITDYEIPELETTYKKLLASVKAKTIPLVFNTPLESEVFYVATTNKGSSFVEVMSKVFKNNFAITENLLSKVDQFTTNLGDFTYLKEVKDKDKLGKWFVFTRDLKTHYLDHLYLRGDPIVVSYITGNELSSRSEEKIYSKNLSITGGESFKMISLGNITPNSSVDIEISPERKTGTNITKKVVVQDVKGLSCGTNCVQREIYCRWEINSLFPYDLPLEVNKSLSGELKQLSLVVNNQEFSLVELVKEKLASVSWPESNLLHLSIGDISKIVDIQNFEENLLGLKIQSEVKNDFVGIKLTHVDRYWDGDGGCPQYTVTQGAILGVNPISTESIHLDKIKQWGSDLNPKFKPNLSYRGRENFYDQIFLSVSSVINNYHN